MAQVPEKVLNWLYRVLHEYQDPQRAYSDVVRTLTAYPSLSPRTEVYNYDNGSSALLLTLANTIPVTFRGTTYRFPIQLWIPHAYPQEPPIVHVVPGQDMMIRPGQHVGVDGKVYHPYLADWSRMWDRASIAEFVEYLQQAFAKEPPVISRAQQQQFQRNIGQQQQAGPSTGPPSLPPKQRVGSVGSTDTSVTGSMPPPRPPKPGEEGQPTSVHPTRTSSRQMSHDGPPLPPLPHERAPVGTYAAHAQGSSAYAESSRSPPQSAMQYQNTRAAGPPLPQFPAQQYQQYRQTYERSPVSPISPANGYTELPVPKQSHPHFQQRQSQFGQQSSASYQRQYSAPSHQHYPTGQPYPPQAIPHQQMQPQPKKQPPPDLLSDPFDIALPAQAHQGPAPPIPPNPEKEHLLHALSTTLTTLANQKISQNLSALAPLHAQQSALLTARATLETELRDLERLDQTLASNEHILRASIRDCDRTIAQAKSTPPPNVDEVLIAPTMVANQLWKLCAEEAACRQAMYVLQRGVDRGRVSGQVFVKQMRSLNRECFLKMALARKCARGMGLEV